MGGSAVFEAQRHLQCGMGGSPGLGPQQRMQCGKGGSAGLGPQRRLQCGRGGCSGLEPQRRLKLASLLRLGVAAARLFPFLLCILLCTGPVVGLEPRCPRPSDTRCCGAAACWSGAAGRGRVRQGDSQATSAGHGRTRGVRGCRARARLRARSREPRVPGRYIARGYEQVWSGCSAGLDRDSLANQAVIFHVAGAHRLVVVLLDGRRVARRHERGSRSVDPARFSCEKVFGPKSTIHVQFAPQIEDVP